MQEEGNMEAKPADQRRGSRLAIAALVVALMSVLPLLGILPKFQGDLSFFQSLNLPGVIELSLVGACISALAFLLGLVSLARLYMQKEALKGRFFAWAAIGILLLSSNYLALVVLWAFSQFMRGMYY